jgi:hydrogenase expression/formation protein HypC
MCLAVPMQIESIDGFMCRCVARGIEREVSLFMLQGEELEPGDHILVHVGYAIQKVTAAIGDNEIPVMYLIGERYVEALKGLANSQNSKVVLMPAEIPTAIRGIVGGMK